jgi:predicted outer membrane repeat protein
LSEIRVTNTNDSGSGSLRNAVDTANPGDKILFDVSGTITLINQININKTININGRPGLAISGSTTRIFNITGANTTVEIINLTLKNGNDITVTGPFGGGAILNDGARLIVIRCTFLNNKSSTIGGAIANQNSGKVSIFRSSFTSNTASTGGAISNFFPLDTDVFISESLFTSNTSTSGDGGAIANGGILRVYRTTFEKNSAPIGVGGAIASSEKANITRTLIRFNTATSGGAIANTGTITIVLSEIRFNSTPQTIGVDPAPPTVDESSSDHSHHHHHHHHDENDDESSS